MSEIDFEELDKAVSNLMGSVKGVDTSAPKSTETAVRGDGNPSADDAQKESESQEGSVMKSTAEPKERREVPRVNRMSSSPRSSGRFMDVVHPSADMRAKAAPTPTVPSAVSVPSPSATFDQQPKVDDATPLTPFLPDANEKVKKRPLGAKSWFSRHVDNKSDEENGVVEEAVTQAFESKPINSEYADDSMPDKNDEKGQDQRPLDATDFEVFSEEQRKLQSIESVEVQAPIENEVAVQAVESGDTEHLRNPTERGEKDVKVPAHEEHTGIYDTNAYHQPLGNPKKKSGWVTIVTIILIIALCIGAAVTAYYFLG